MRQHLTDPLKQASLLPWQSDARSFDADYFVATAIARAASERRLWLLIRLFSQARAKAENPNGYSRQVSHTRIAARQVLVFVTRREFSQLSKSPSATRSEIAFASAPEAKRASRAMLNRRRRANISGYSVLSGEGNEARIQLFAFSTKGIFSD